MSVWEYSQRLSIVISTSWWWEWLPCIPRYPKRRVTLVLGPWGEVGSSWGQVCLGWRQLPWEVAGSTSLYLVIPLGCMIHTHSSWYLLYGHRHPPLGHGHTHGSWWPSSLHDRQPPGLALHKGYWHAPSSRGQSLHDSNGHAPNRARN